MRAGQVALGLEHLYVVCVTQRAQSKPGSWQRASARFRGRRLVAWWLVDARRVGLAAFSQRDLALIGREKPHCRNSICQYACQIADVDRCSLNQAYEIPARLETLSFSAAESWIDGFWRTRGGRWFLADRVGCFYQIAGILRGGRAGTAEINDSA